MTAMLLLQQVRVPRPTDGTYRLDTPEGRRPINIPLGTLQELPTKVSARDRLREKIAEMMSSDAIPQTTSSMKFSELVEKWKRSE